MEQAAGCSEIFCQPLCLQQGLVAHVHHCASFPICPSARAVAIALACNPELLLADEPTTALDVTIQAQVLQMMNELKKQFDTSMLLITHDLGVVAQTCDKVAVCGGGAPPRSAAPPAGWG